MNEKVRFSRSQKFRLSTNGAAAVEAYQVTIEAARSGHGRAEFDAACEAWGKPFGLKPSDALFLVEFGTQGRTLKEASESLETSGTTPKQVKEGVERLMGVGMLEAVPAPLQR